MARLLASASLAAIATPVVAQEQATSPALEDIVVTAQKREERLQDTPLAVTALSEATIEARDITDASDLSAVAPNLIATITPSSTANVALFIRGIGTAEPILTIDAPVSLYVDGVVLGRSTGAVFDLVELERIEVLRGPQGTLYGRNTTGGAVNLIAKKPADEFGAKGTISYGNLDYKQARVTLDTGQWGDTGLRSKLSYLHKERDGYFNDLNQPDGNDPGAYNLDAFTIAISYDHGGPFRANYTFDFNDRHSWAVPFQVVAMRPDIFAYLNVSPQLGGNAPVVARERLDALRLDMGPIHDKVQGHGLSMELDLGDNLMLKSLTGRRMWDNRQTNGDLDGNSGLVGFVVSPAILAPPNPFIPLGVRTVNLFSASNTRHQDQWSQEFNLVGNFDSLDFVFGAFYFDEDSSENNPQFLTIVQPLANPIPLGPGISTPGFGINIATGPKYQHESTSKALFGQATWHATDKLSITGGLRYTWDKKHLDQETTFRRDLTRKFNEPTWSASVDYEWNDDIMTYARVATGYLAGGFNARSANAGFDPEKITSYEAGVKSELFDRRLRLNLAAFYAKYKDIQVQQFVAGSGGATSITVNAGKATYQGIEAEAMAVPIDGLTFNATIGYVDRDYQEFLVLDPATNTIVDEADNAKFGYSPATTINLGGQYELPPFDFGTFTARLDYTYRGKVYYHPLTRFAPFNDVISDDSVGLLDGRLTLSDIAIGGSKAALSVWGKNLTNANYQNAGIDFGSLGFAGVAWAEKRTYGMDLKFEF
nr:TonB-dependent receptor [Sphingomonas laterariae]